MADEFCMVIATINRTLEEQSVATTRCPTCLAPPGVECDRTDGLRWRAHAARVLRMSREGAVPD